MSLFIIIFLIQQFIITVNVPGHALFCEIYSKYFILFDAIVRELLSYTFLQSYFGTPLKLVQFGTGCTDAQTLSGYSFVWFSVWKLELVGVHGLITATPSRRDSLFWAHSFLYLLCF